MCHDFRPSCCLRLLDASVEIVPFFEVDIENMVAADHAVQGHGIAVDVNALQYGDFSGEWHNVARNLLKILQFAG